AVDALRGLGLFAVAGESRTVDEIVRTHRIVPHLGRVVRRWLDALSRRGVLRREADAYVATTALESAPIDQQMQALRAVADWPPNVYAFIERAGRNLRGMLIGEVHPLELFFAGGDVELPLFLYHHGVGPQYLNAIVREALRAFVEAHSGVVAVLE